MTRTCFLYLLPPAYVVRQEGNSFTLFVSPHLGGGYPYPIMLCNISQNAMGQPLGGGVPCQVQPGGVPPHPARLGQGGTQLGQHREYLLHGGRYASCVHAGGLSCLLMARDIHYGHRVKQLSCLPFMHDTSLWLYDCAVI